MERLARDFPTAEGFTKEALDQAARELLLAQSSDWAFIVTNATSVPYAIKRLREHLVRFHRLAEMVENAAPVPAEIAAMRERDPIFPWLDYRVFAPA
jgi:1,4-alpha-glucan branching enzyme